MVQMKNFYQVMEDLLEYEGYELLFGGKGKIVGKSGEDIKSFVIAGERLTEDDIKDIQDSEGEKVLIVFEKIDEEKLAEVPEDADIWDRDELIRRLGEMTLEMSVLEGITEGEGGIKGKGEIEFRKENGEKTLKPIMDFEHISELGEKLVKGFKYRLELVPHYLFSFRLEKPGGGVEKGRLYLNGISGLRNFWDDDFERVRDVKRSHVKLEPNMPQEKSEKKALMALKDRYRMESESKWEEDGATIVEKVKEEPDEEKIDMAYQGIVYVPMWAVEGTEGVVVINAATGKVERESEKIDEKRV